MVVGSHCFRAGVWRIPTGAALVQTKAAPWGSGAVDLAIASVRWSTILTTDRIL